MKRHLFITLGFLSLVLGIIGAFLPIMPTAPFVILAAFFFSRSSPRLHDWLLTRPHVGPIIRDWDRNHAIRPHIKAIASVSILAGIAFTATRPQIPLWGKIAGAAVTLSALVYVVTRPSGPAP